MTPTPLTLAHLARRAAERQARRGVRHPLAPQAAALAAVLIGRYVATSDAAREAMGR